MLDSIARLVTARPRRVLAATVALLAVAVVFGGPVATKLTVEADTDFIDPQAESNVTSLELRRAIGRGLNPEIVVLVRSAGPVRGTAGRAKLRRVVARIESDPAIAKTDSALSDPRPGEPVRVARRPLELRRRLPRRRSRQRRRRDSGSKPRSSGFPGVSVGGGAVAGPAVGDQVSEDLAKGELLAFPLLFLLSLFVFRGAIAALLPLFVGLLTIMTTFLGLRLFNEATPLSIFALNLAIGLGLGLAIDYSLFILSRYREEMTRDGPGREALRPHAADRRADGRVQLADGRRGDAVAARLPAALPLLDGDQRLDHRAQRGLIALTALPALLMALGPRVDALAPQRWRHREVDPESGFWYRLSHLVMRRPVLVAVTTAAVLVAAGIPFTRIEFTGVDASVLPDSAVPKQVDTALRTEFPPGRTSPLHVAVSAPREQRGGAARVRRPARCARRRRGRRPSALRRRRHVATSRSSPTRPALDGRTLDLVRAVRAGPSPGHVRVGGEAARFVDQRAGLAHRLPLAIGVLAITTLLILFAMTGSVVLPLKALVMNVLGLSAAFGLLVLVFQDGRLEGLLDYTSQGALEITQPLVLLAIAFGLSTDYGVFLLTRIKEARDAGATNEEAVALGIQRTGRIVTAAALLLVVALGAFATSQIVFIKQLGIGTAAAVAIDATIVRALLVPALMKLLGDRNWWAPAPLARLHARLRLGE